MNVKRASLETLLLFVLASAFPSLAIAADIFSGDVLLADRYRNITPVASSELAPAMESVPESLEIAEVMEPVQPEAIQPEAIQPEAIQPEAIQPETIQVESTTPTVAAMEPESTAAGSAADSNVDVAEMGETDGVVAASAEETGFFGRMRQAVRGYLLEGTPEYEAEQRAAARQRAAAAQQAPAAAVASPRPETSTSVQREQIEPTVMATEVAEVEVPEPPVPAPVVREVEAEPVAPAPVATTRPVVERSSEDTAEKKRPLIFRLLAGKEDTPVLEQLENYEDIATAELGDRAEMFVTAGPGETGVSLIGGQMNLRDYLHLVAIYNDRVAYQKLEWAIAKSGVDSARALYEPELMASYRYTDSNTPNTTEEEFRRSFAAEFIEENDDYSVGVEGLIPTGARLKVTYNLRSLENNIQPAPIRGEENKSYVGFSITQPVLKGAGGRRVVEAPILVARKEEGIAMQTFRQALLQSISGAATAYLDAYLAEKKTDLRKRSVEIAESVVNDERERQRFGRSAETTVLDAESALAQRRVQFLTAQQELLAARNEMHRLIASRAGESRLPMMLETSLMTDVGSLNREAVLEDAFSNRPEYLASILRAESESVKVRYARNNRLPQLDLVASYGLNGLADTSSNSWDDVWDRQHETLFVGLEFKMPLLGNRKASGELSAANLRKHQALLEIKAAEVAIYNSVDTALSNIRSAMEQVDELSMVRETNERLLGVEIARFEAGQSNSRDLLELEERMNRVMEMDLESKINLQKASIGLGLSDGTLLQRFQLEK